MPMAWAFFGILKVHILSKCQVVYLWFPLFVWVMEREDRRIPTLLMRIPFVDRAQAPPPREVLKGKEEDPEVEVAALMVETRVTPVVVEVQAVIPVKVVLVEVDFMLMV